VKDVTFNEVNEQIRTGNGPQMRACLRNESYWHFGKVKNATNIVSALRDIASKPHSALELIGL